MLNVLPLPKSVNVAAIGVCVKALSKERLRLVAVVFLLICQAALLAYSATRHSPTYLEPAFLVSGISHWTLGRFESYRVNPPLVRMVAALPVLAMGCETDWSQFDDGAGSRPEFRLGEDFLKANGSRSISLFVYARWACIPFNLIGAYFAYRWARELYRSASAGFVTLVLYIFEPSLLAHGELITPDGACAAFGTMAGYAFWRWLKQPTWIQAFLAGGALGLAELTKLTWIVLFAVWPVLWFMWQRMSLQHAAQLKPGCHNLENSLANPSLASIPLLCQFGAILLLGVYLINVGYCFDGFGTCLKEFRFVSTMLSGHSKPGTPGNRFVGTWLGELPVPLPKQYVLGFDSQKKDFEYYGQKSYLRGEWKSGGWWYYYLYGLLVKVPCGTCVLFVIALLVAITRKQHSPRFRDEIVLLAPALSLLFLVSSQTEFNIHLRYVLPSLAMLLIFTGNAGSLLTRRVYAVKSVPILLALYTCLTTLFFFPHHLAYFNDFVGGPQNGHKHLLGSSKDWGQGLLDIVKWASDANDQPLISLRTRFKGRQYLIPDAFSTINKTHLIPDIIVLETDQFYQEFDTEGRIVKTFVFGTVLLKDK